MSWASAKIHLHNGITYHVNEDIGAITAKIDALIRVDDFVELKEGAPPETVRVRVRASEIAAIEELLR